MSNSKTNMSKNYAIKTLQEQVDSLDFDLKAEAFAAFLPNTIKTNYNFADYFNRRFRKDITHITQDKHNAVGEWYEVTLSRRSFYNIFPERFFHATYGSTPYVENMLVDYRNRKKEEEKTRAFFKPLENEFFAHSIANEKEENSMLKSLSGDDLVSFLKGIWDIDARFPKKMTSKLLKAIPFVHKIAGDTDKILEVLQTIIGERITLSKGFAKLPQEALVDHGPKYLGVNFATSINTNTYLPKYIFTVDVISAPENIENYLKSGNITAVMNFFLNYTLPFEADFEVNFTIAKKKQSFLMAEVIYAGRLGISTTI